MKTVLNTLFVGIDVDSQTNALYMMNFLQKGFNRFRVKNDFNGVEILKDKTVEVLRQEKLEYVIFVLESTSVYAFHTATYLSSNEDLLVYNPKVYCINPKISCN